MSSLGDKTVTTPLLSGVTFTVDQAVEHVGFGPFQILLLLYTGMAWIGDAAEMMILSFLGPSLECYWNLTKLEQSWLTTVVFIGMLFGAQGWGAVADTYGRKVGFFATALFTAVMGVASALSPNYPMLLVFRGLVGFGLGGVPVVFALFSEFIPKNQRAFYLIVIELFWTIGSMLEGGLAWIILPRFGWRWLLGISAIPLALLMLLYPLLPESPRYYMLKGQKEKALKVLQTIAKINRKSLPEGKLAQEISTSQNSEEKKTENQVSNNIFIHVGSLLQGLFSKGYLKQSILFIWVWLAASLSYYAIILLATQVNSSSRECLSRDTPGFTDDDYRNTFITSAAEVPGLLLAAIIVDRIGRRNSSALCTAGTAIILIPLFFISNNDTATIILSVGRCIAMAGFVVVYLYTPEVYPTVIRAFALGIYNSVARLAGMLAPFVSVELYGTGRKNVALVLLIVISGVASVLSWMLPIETKGKRLRESFDEDESEEEEKPKLTKFEEVNGQI